MIIVSACLAGVNCRYNGENTANDEILELIKIGEALPLCPEILGGLTVPRDPCEIQIDNYGKKKVVSKNGKDFTNEFIKGAEITLNIANLVGAKKAILQARSPSCGSGMIYDGSFSGKLVSGKGICAELLSKNGLEVIIRNNNS